MKTKQLYQRDFHIDGVEEDHGSFVTMSFSSEQPYQRMEDGETFNEVLLHGPENIDMTRAGQKNGLPLLINHEKKALPVGRIKNLRVGSDRKLRGDVYFSGRQLGQEIKQDVLSGVITDTSLGYLVKAAKTIPGQRGEPPTCQATRWMPFEGSMVGVQADPTVGLDRAMGGPLDDGTSDPTIASPVQSSNEVSLGLGEASDMKGPEIGEEAAEPAAEAAAEPAAEAALEPEAEGTRELGLIDGIIDVSDGTNTTLDNASDPAAPIGEPAAATSDSTEPADLTQHEDDDTGLDFQRTLDPVGVTSVALAKSITEQLIANAAEATRIFGGDKPAPSPEDMPDPSLTASAPGTVSQIDVPAPADQPAIPAAEPIDPEDDDDLPSGDSGVTRTFDSAQPEFQEDSTLEALRSVALKFNTTRTRAEIDGILSTRSLSEARSILLSAPEPPSQMVRYIEPGRPKMLNPRMLTRAMGECAKGNWGILDADDSSVKEVLTRTAKGFTVDLFHDSLGGGDGHEARQRYLSGSSYQRDMTTTNTTSPVNPQAIGFIDWLFARTALLKAGARVKTGVGSLFYLKATAAAAVTAQNEDATAPGNTAMTYTRVPYVPHMLVAEIPLTEELQKESVFDLQPILRNNVSKAFATKMDAVGLAGDATYTSPIQGILMSGNSTQINLGVAAEPAFKDVNALKAQVDLVDVDLDTCSYITHPKLMGTLENTPRLAGGLLPMADRRQINGFNAFTTANMVPSGSDYSLLFGDFNECEFCFQGPLEVIVDQITKASQGITNLIFRQYYDFGVLQSVAFSHCDNYLL